MSFTVATSWLGVVTRLMVDVAKVATAGVSAMDGTEETEDREIRTRESFFSACGGWLRRRCW